MAKEVSRQLLMAGRAFQQLADQTIKKDPVRALVELITNSDDSYKKLEKLGLNQVGKIEIYFQRHQKHSVIRVLDHAAGMSSELMDEAVGIYGAETHGFAGGQGGRSFFGRGLKEAILGMGSGFVRSIQNNLFHESVLTISKYEREAPREAVQIFKDELGIPSRGTAITLIIDRKDIKIPQFDNLKSSLGLHYAIRDILSSPKRVVRLIEKKENEQIKNEAILSYFQPKGEVVINDTIEIAGYEGAEAKLVVSRSFEDLTGREEGYTRQNGILICSKGAIHDIGLFKYEGEELTKNLFGRLTCDQIDICLRNDEPIVNDSRDGLDYSHPLIKIIRTYIEKKLAEYIIEEKEKNKTNEVELESDSTKKRFKKAIDAINSIVEKELENISTAGEGIIKQGGMVPPNGLDFIPSYYNILVGKRSMLTLKLDTDKIDEDPRGIKLMSNSPQIELHTKKIEEENIISDGTLRIIHITVEGKQIGEENLISAALGKYNAKALIRVVAKKEKVKRPWEPRKHRGMFNDIKYNPDSDPNMRVRFEKISGNIIIATKSQSVRQYLGLNGEYQGNPEALTLTAELVLQAVCMELTQLLIQSGKEQILGEPEVAITTIYNRYINKYSSIFHEILGPKK